MGNARLQAVNEELKTIGRRHKKSELDAEGYRRECVRVLRVFESEPEDAQETHPGIAPVNNAPDADKAQVSQKDHRKLLWLLPLAFAILFLLILALMLY